MFSLTPTGPIVFREYGCTAQCAHPAHAADRLPRRVLKGLALVSRLLAE